ncbi:FLYWCH zinc finger domain-containing protein [Phthorimaea operculella]|nr:FLYWCH zinc finger domain-containing protein [Phthorimaea operculella]
MPFLLAVESLNAAYLKDVPEFLQTRCGNPVIVFRGFRYNLSPAYRTKLRKLWTCSRPTSGCRAKLYTVQGNVVEQKGDHTHTPSNEKTVTLTNRFTIKFGLTRGGREVATIEGHRFYKNNRSKGHVSTWFCSRSGCKASARIADNQIIAFKNEHNHQISWLGTALMRARSVPVCYNGQPHFSMTAGGREVATFDGYRFYRNNRSKGAVATWFCSRSMGSGCRASVRIADNQILFYKNGHNHDRPHFSVTPGGREVATLDGYRYYKNYRSKGTVATWFCSRSMSRFGCKASLRIANSQNIIAYKNEHNHE